MTNGLYSRLAGRDDAERIADLSRRTFYDSFAAQNTKENMDQFLNEQFTREKLLAEVGNPDSQFLLAFLEGELAGYARLMEGHQPLELGDVNAIEIARIYAEQNAIGKGVGKALMQHCLVIAREKGKEWIWLGVWEQNRRAIDFYMKWGFEKFGEHIFVVGSDPQTDWMMKRKI